MASVGTPAGRGRRRLHGIVVPTASSSSLLVRWSMFLFLVHMVFVFDVVVVEATPQQPQRTILVTGGAGFVGSHLADALLERGDRVVIIDEVNDYYDVKIKEGNLRMLELKYNHCHFDKNVGGGDGDDETDHDNDDHADLEDGEDRDCMLTIYRGDICNRTVLDQVFERHKFDAIAHLAARAGVRPSILDPFVYVHSNIKATIALLDRAVHYNISHFVYASSSSVYGGSRSTYFSENERVDRPISPYAATKTACELFAYAYHKKFGINTAALRFFTVYGPRGRPDMAVWYVLLSFLSLINMNDCFHGQLSQLNQHLVSTLFGRVQEIHRPGQPRQGHSTIRRRQQQSRLHVRVRHCPGHCRRPRSTAGVQDLQSWQGIRHVVARIVATGGNASGQNRPG
jgi:UDP-glucuronate 4-epimerase